MQESAFLGADCYFIAYFFSYANNIFLGRLCKHFRPCLPSASITGLYRFDFGLACVHPENFALALCWQVHFFD